MAMLQRAGLWLLPRRGGVRAFSSRHSSSRPALRKRRRRGGRGAAAPSEAAVGSAATEGAGAGRSERWTPERQGVVSMAPFVPTPALGVDAALRLLQMDPESDVVRTTVPLPPVRAAAAGAARRTAAAALCGTAALLQLTRRRAAQFLDLGCGDGRLVAAASPHCRTALGGELDADLATTAAATLAPLPNARVIEGDLLGSDGLDLRALGITHAYSFLSPRGQELLLPLLQATLDPGARVVTASFPLLLEEDDNGREWRREGSEQVFDMEFYAFTRL